MTPMRLACISDVCLGYGSPQIPQLVNSLRQHCRAETLVLEPHRPTMIPKHDCFPFKIQRVPLNFDPYGVPGRVEYLLDSADLLNRFMPDILVVCCTFCLPVLFKLRKRPPFVIYYSLESIPFYGNFDVEMNRYVNDLINLVIFPEENRAAMEVERFHFGDAPKIVLYNCADVNPHDVEEGFSPTRNGRVIHAGTIDREATLADYYTAAEAQQYPIDLYGPIRSGSEAEKRAFIDQLAGHVRYRGYLGNDEVSAARKQYAYSIVAWNPSAENQLYAAPNKFFESIADGVPPIAAPHPQCKMLIQRYGCGLLMDNWSDVEFFRTLKRAFRLYNTPAWREMVCNCAVAVREELNWSAQFDKLRPYLRSI